MRKNFRSNFGKIAVIAILAVMTVIFPCEAEAEYPNMVYVNGGYGLMGAEVGDLISPDDAKPVHAVDLDPYYIDMYEVTNGDYSVCVAAGKCAEPEKAASKTRESYYGDPAYDRFPVVNVTWEDAQNYCLFMEKRLPTEAEWERAARGNHDDRRYPWGNGSIKSYYINTSGIPGDTEMPNSYPKGNSLYGVADVAGNVSEWVSDWYDDTYYEMSEERAPQGPETGTEKVVRGDSFETMIASVNIMNRYHLDPEQASDSVGFRCVKEIRSVPTYDFAEENVDLSMPEYEKGYIKAGNENGIFLLNEPGNGTHGVLIGIVPNGTVVELLVGPVQINYSNWYQIRTQNGEQGWTLANAIRTFEKTDK